MNKRRSTCASYMFCTFQLQPYLINVNSDKYRYALTRLLVSSHCLEVARGRCHKPNKILFGKCQYCNCLEDEFHFIFECPMYNNTRHIYCHEY